MIKADATSSQCIPSLHWRGSSHLKQSSVADLDKVQRRLGQRHAQMYVPLLDYAFRDLLLDKDRGKQESGNSSKHTLLNLL